MKGEKEVLNLRAVSWVTQSPQITPIFTFRVFLDISGTAGWYTNVVHRQVLSSASLEMAPAIHCVSKNATALACYYNFDVYQPILIFFGTDVAKKVSSQMVIVFHLT